MPSQNQVTSQRRKEETVIASRLRSQAVTKRLRRKKRRRLKRRLAALGTRASHVTARAPKKSDKKNRVSHRIQNPRASLVKAETDPSHLLPKTRVVARRHRRLSQAGAKLKKRAADVENAVLRTVTGETAHGVNRIVPSENGLPHDGSATIDVRGPPSQPVIESVTVTGIVTATEVQCAERARPVLGGHETLTVIVTPRDAQTGAEIEMPGPKKEIGIEASLESEVAMYQDETASVEETRRGFEAKKRTETVPVTGTERVTVTVTVTVENLRAEEDQDRTREAAMTHDVTVTGAVTEIVIATATVKRSHLSDGVVGVHRGEHKTSKAKQIVTRRAIEGVHQRSLRAAPSPRTGCQKLPRASSRRQPRARQKRKEMTASHPSLKALLPKMVACATR